MVPTGSWKEDSSVIIITAVKQLTASKTAPSLLLRICVNEKEEEGVPGITTVKITNDLGVRGADRARPPLHPCKRVWGQCNQQHLNSKMSTRRVSWDCQSSGQLGMCPEDLGVTIWGGGNTNALGHRQRNHRSHHKNVAFSGCKPFLWGFKSTLGMHGSCLGDHLSNQVGISGRLRDLEAILRY